MIENKNKEEKGLTVLSLFDGMSCGQIALKRAGIKVEKYYASEIDKNSIKVTMKNFPNTIQLGDVKEIDEGVISNIGEVDLLIGGSPCTNLSFAVINNPLHNQGLEGEKSKLFYEFVRLLKLVKPKYFLLENVESMSDKDRDIISEVLGTQPIMIDSALFSAQQRKRYYWTNISVDQNYPSSGVMLKDILQPASEIDEKFWYNIDYDYMGEDKKIIAKLHLKGHDILKRVNNREYKAPTLTTCSGGNTQKKVFQNGRCRKLTPTEYERLQTVPQGYTEGVANSHRYNMLGNGWTVDVIAHIFKDLKK